MCKIIQHHKIFKETGGDTKTEQQTKLVRKLLVKFADYGKQILQQLGLLRLAEIKR